MTTPAKDRKLQILAAAARSFARRGFHAATMQDVCKEAELSPGSVYRYYRSKEEIITALIELDCEQSLAVLKKIQAEEDVITALFRWVELNLGRGEIDQTALYVEVTAEAIRNPRIRPILERTDTIIIEAFTEIIRRGQAQGTIEPSLNAQSAAVLLCALGDGLVARKEFPPAGKILKDLTSFKALFTHFLRPAQQKRENS